MTGLEQFYKKKGGNDEITIFGYTGFCFKIFDSGNLRFLWGSSFEKSKGEAQNQKGFLQPEVLYKLC